MDDEGDVVTAGGVTAGLDPSPWIVDRFRGADVADGIATELADERSGDVIVAE